MTELQSIINPTKLLVALQKDLLVVQVTHGGVSFLLRRHRNLLKFPASPTFTLGSHRDGPFHVSRLGWRLLPTPREPIPMYISHMILILVAYTRFWCRGYWARIKIIATHLRSNFGLARARAQDWAVVPIVAKTQALCLPPWHVGKMHTLVLFLALPKLHACVVALTASLEHFLVNHTILSSSKGFHNGYMQRWHPRLINYDKDEWSH